MNSRKSEPPRASRRHKPIDLVPWPRQTVCDGYRQRHVGVRAVAIMYRPPIGQPGIAIVSDQELPADRYGPITGPDRIVTFSILLAIHSRPSADLQADSGRLHRPPLPRSCTPAKSPNPETSTTANSPDPHEIDDSMEYQVQTYTAPENRVAGRFSTRVIL